MKLKDYSPEDLEQMSYGEITEIILSEKNSKMKIVDIFKKICQVLSMSDSEFENKVADYFELISTDSRFIILDKGYCDLRKKHVPKIILEEEEEIELPEEDVTEDSEEVEEEENEDDIFYDSSSDDDDVTDEDDDFDNFVLVDEEEETSI